MSTSFCGICGAQETTLAAGEPAEVGGPAEAALLHEACRVRSELEPPRFCTMCGRRMVVQVTPAGWWARCSRHGEINAGR